MSNIASSRMVTLVDALRTLPPPLREPRILFAPACAKAMMIGRSGSEVGAFDAQRAKARLISASEYGNLELGGDFSAVSDFLIAAPLGVASSCLSGFRRLLLMLSQPSLNCAPTVTDAACAKANKNWARFVSAMAG